MPLSEPARLPPLIEKMDDGRPAIVKKWLREIEPEKPRKPNGCIVLEMQLIVLMHDPGTRK